MDDYQGSFSMNPFKVLRPLRHAGWPGLAFWPSMLILSFTPSVTCLHAAEFDVLRQESLTVLYDSALRQAAQDTVDIYPSLRADLQHTFGLDLNLKPTVLLLKNRNQFQRMAESPLTVAFAVPSKNLVVIDYSKMNINPFNLHVILKHELCHLLLHQHIPEALLPRWLDEGISQWASDGIGDIIMDQKRSLLNRAALKSSFIPLNALEEGFPRDKESLSLAYEESKSFVLYIISKYGKVGILRVLKCMIEGETADTAFMTALSIPLLELEKKWHQSLKQKVTWFTYLSYYIYEILFAVAAFVTIYAFIRAIVRKRAYMRGSTDNGPYA